MSASVANGSITPRGDERIMMKTKVRRTGMLLGVAGLAAAVSSVTLSVASEPAQAMEGTSCQYGTAPIPVGTEVVDPEYYIVIRDGKLFHRHYIYKCEGDGLWHNTQRYVDLETEVIGCCASGKGKYGEILT